MTKIHKKKGLSMWLIATIFAFVQFFLQIVFSTMTNQVMKDFHIGAGMVGILSSTFFYTFIFLQVPAGIILDRVNIRAVLTSACAICGLGCILFGIAPSLAVAVVGRLLMGIGATFGFLGMAKIVRLCYKKERFALMVGLSELLANLTAAFGIGVASFFVIKFGWRNNMVTYGVVVLLIAALAYMVLETPSSSKKPRTYNLTIWKQIILVSRKPQCWFTCIYILSMCSVVTTFCSLWGLPFLSSVYKINNEMAGLGISIVFVGLAIGCPIIGFIAASIGNVRNIMMICAFLCLVTMVFITFPVILYTKSVLYLMLFLLGFFSSSYFLSYEKMKQLVHESVGGIALGLCNMSGVIGALFFQPLIGFVLEVSTKKPIFEHGHQIYTAAQYKTGMFVMIAILLVGFIISFFIKTKKDLQKQKIKKQIKIYKRSIKHESKQS